MTKERMQAIRDDLHKAVDYICDIIDALQMVAEEVRKIIVQVLEMEPRKRYKLVRKLGEQYIPLFFKRQDPVHCRNNC